MKTIRGIAVLLAAALLLSLSACGASDGNSSETMVEPSVSDSDPGWNGAYGESYDKSDGLYDVPQDPQESAPSLPDNSRIIYTADLELETTEFDNASQALDHIVAGLGGWFESRTIHQGSSYRSLTCTIRVPADSFNALLDQAGQAALMTYRQEYQNDVSESYYDTEARLTTQRTKLARLQELLAKAETMADIITLESAISDTELEIEYLTGSLRHYDSLIGYSTVTLSLREVYRLSSDQEPAVTFSQRLSAAFSDGFRQTIEGLEDLAVLLARNWVVLLVFGTVAVTAVCVIVRAEKRNRQRRQGQALPPEEE